MRKLTGICAVDGCDKPRRRKEWCMPHYKRWWRHGDPTAGAAMRHRGPLPERFWAKVEKSPQPDGCWVWSGTTNNKGYGMVSVSSGGSKTIRTTHRLSWELANGPIPEGLHVCHRCDNPPCVRPDHLFLGTHADNIADMWAKGRRSRDGLFPR